MWACATDPDADQALPRSRSCWAPTAPAVAALGAKVQGFKIGDQVYSYSWDNPQGGFYAEYVAVPAERVGHVPKGLTLTQAGAIGTTALTAIQGVDDALHLSRARRSSSTAPPAASARSRCSSPSCAGRACWRTVSGEDEIAAVKALGADVVVDGTHGDLPAAAHAFAPEAWMRCWHSPRGEALEQRIDALQERRARAPTRTGVHPVPKARAGLRTIRMTRSRAGRSSGG